MTELPVKHKGQASFQKPAPDKPTPCRNPLLGLQHPLSREHLPGQPLVQHGRLIEGFGRRFEDRFHDVMRVAAV